MSDQVKCIGVLDGDRLMVACPGKDDIRVLPVRPAGTTRTKEPEWEYSLDEDTIRLTPSLLCPDTQFHTAYNWSCRFVRCPEGKSCYNYFHEVNNVVK